MLLITDILFRRDGYLVVGSSVNFPLVLSVPVESCIVARCVLASTTGSTIALGEASDGFGQYAVS